MLFITWVLNHKMIHALAWSLVHSLWQGWLVAIIAALVIGATRRSKPAVRYNLLTGTFLLFVMLVAITFLYEVTAGDQTFSRTANPVLLQTGSTTVSAHGIVVNTPPTTNYFEIAVLFFNDHASLIVLVWGIFFLLKLLRMTAGLSYSHKIRHHRTAEPPSRWIQRIQELSQSLNIRRPVLLLESPVVKTPMVTGFLKPFILVPLGLLSHLTAEQVETILVHELAHIRRNDYIVNLLQRLVETIFFFNPGLLWISSLIRDERENCCDDLTVKHTKNKKQFIHALVAFQEYLLWPSGDKEIIAFSGQKRHLLSRVRRIIYNENKKLNAMEKGIFALSTVAVILIGFTSIKQTSTPAHSVWRLAQLPKIVPANETISPTDTIPGKKEFTGINLAVSSDGDKKIRTITATDKKGKTYKMIVDADGPMELYIDDKKVPSEEAKNYSDVVSSLEEAVELGHRGTSFEAKVIRDEQDRKLRELDAQRNELLKKLSSLEEERARLGIDEAHQNAPALQDLTMDADKNHRVHLLNQKQLFDQGTIDFGLSKNDVLWQKPDTVSDNGFGLLQKNGDVMKDFQMQVLPDKLTQLQNPGSQNFQPLGNQRQSNTLSQYTDPVIEDLVNQRVVDSPGNLESFELTDRSLLVNDVKQPAEIHERFKEKFLKKKSDYLKYSHKNGHTGISVNLN